MTEPPPHQPPKAALRRHAKADLVTRLIVVRGFCLGLSVKGAAKASSLSEKSVREMYLDLRQRLLKPLFNKWHHAFQHLVRVQSEDIEEAIRDAFYDTLSQCYFDPSCYRNFAAGNRKVRLCRSCPLPGRLSSEARVAEALSLIDAVRSLYQRLGITAEHGIDRVTLFKLRLIHTATLIVVATETRRLPSGAYDPEHRAFRSYRTLFDALLADLIDDPAPSPEPPRGKES